jgi:CheY-like chemotaxis protein
MSLIVIVDDRITNRTIYSRLAMSIGEGVKVQAFGDPCEALEWLANNRPDLIITDYDMPKLDGEEFIGRFRAMPDSAAVPIMMITVNDQRMLRLRALESGATDFLTTPIDHCEFLSRARNLLKLSRGAGSRAAANEAARQNSGPARAQAEGAISSQEAQFLAQCAGAQGFALHMVEIADTSRIDPAVLVDAMRRQLRGDDLVARIDGRRFAILQRNVFDSADADACGRRIRGLRNDMGGGVPLEIRVGTSLPRHGAGDPEQRAAACLREAAALARARAEPEILAGPWRYQPRIHLRSGAVAGAQVLHGAGPAEARDPGALRSALTCASALRSMRRPPFYLSLRLSLARIEAAPAALLIAPLLAEARVPPAWLDLRFCAREALTEGARAEEQARALTALGVGLTLDLGALTPASFSDIEAWTEPLRAFAENWRPAILFPSGDRVAAALARFLRRLTARRTGRALHVLADDVASPDLLTPLLRAGVSQVQGSCFGASLSAADLQKLFAAEPDNRRQFVARRA